MTCVSCGARNTERASWCTQCFAPLVDAHVDVGDDVGDSGDVGADIGGDVDVAVVNDTDVAGSVDAGRAAPADASARDIRTRDGEVEWRCAACSIWVALHQPSCPTCDRPRTGFGNASASSERRSVTTSSALAASLVVPGAGHVLTGAVGSGIARAILGLLWLAGGIGVTRGGGGLSAWVLLVGAVVIWVVSAVDVVHQVDGDRPQLLTGRRLGILVAVVTGGLLLTITFSALAGAR